MVVALMGVVLSLLVPSLNSMLDANKISLCGQIINDQVALCRQLAATRGRALQLRIYKPDGAHYSALQIVDANNPAGVVSLGKPVAFPENYVLYPDWSPLIDALSVGTTYTINSGPVQIAGRTDVSGVFLLIRASGAVEPALSAANNYVTVANVRKDPPVNFATVQIDSLSARPTTYRP